MQDNTTIKLPEEHEDLPLEILAEHIARLATVGEQIKHSKLKRRTILLLLKDITGIGIKDIDLILDALPLLGKKFLK